MQPFHCEGAVFLGSRHSDMTRNTLAHSHDFYELNFLTSGKTKMRLNERVVEYDSYDFILIPPLVKHILYESEYERFDNYVIWFQYSTESIPDDRIIKLHDYDGAVQFLCSSIFRMFMSSGMENIELINAYLKAVLLHMNRGLIMGTGAESKKEEDIVDSAVRFINANIRTRKLSVIEIAKVLNAAPTYFSRLFKSKIGVAPVKYINEVKIAEAKRLLISEDKTIQEIAAMLHYEDPLYFSRQFSQLTGCSPKEFRSSQKGKIL